MSSPDNPIPTKHVPLVEQLPAGHLTSDTGEPVTTDDRAIAALDYEQLKRDAGERLKYLSTTWDSVLRGLTLANGGAIVALFTFIGSAHPVVSPGTIKEAFASFAVGLALTLLAGFASFYTHSAYMLSDVVEMRNARDRMYGRHGSRDARAVQRRGERWERVSKAFAALALLSFLLGSWLALTGVLVGQ